MPYRRRDGKRIEESTWGLNHTRGLLQLRVEDVGREGLVSCLPHRSWAGPAAQLRPLIGKEVPPQEPARLAG